ncbi:KAP family P-loop NTPase fold protein [Burkholderia vietnamiensis]|uniref:KAP family P-loop NTPase fold protein n=1 Tax=Burkholderia vietnamiensis TaxID=60552 RepID=UPI0026564FC5|nr:P-loop NTPase fold protein [Burkholderia vietnamiensis]MDN7669681.1 P-loop NTPase fold protein [Burkholderia vietnamiensis]
MTGANQTPLAFPTWRFDPEQPPFHDDQLNRKRYATRLTEFVGRLGEGGVIAIDAPWGGGKTWFGRNWAAHLHASGHKFAFIDAFEQDYVEDPFMVIAAELATLLDDSKGGASLLRGKAAVVMKAILPLGSRLLVNAVGRFALGSADLTDDIQEALDAAREGVADRAEKSIEKKLEDHEDEKKSFVEYRRALAEFAAEQEKPVVVFIDELDRCNPMFAVRLIERIKHFFEIPNVVFVLLLNREQLEQAVKGMFGRETDAAAYLSKFVRFFFRLPAPSAERSSQYGSQAIDFLAHELSRYGFDPSQNRAVADFHAAALIWVQAARMSLRDMEKMCALFALSGPIGPAGLLAYLIALKLRAPSIFDGLLRTDHDSHRAATEWIDGCAAGAGFDGESTEVAYLAAVRELHFGLVAPDQTERKHLTGGIANWILGQMGLSPERAFAIVLKRIDLTLEV